jgi:hypothetical protein
MVLAVLEPEEVLLGIRWPGHRSSETMVLNGAERRHSREAMGKEAIGHEILELKSLSNQVAKVRELLHLPTTMSMLDSGPSSHQQIVHKHVGRTR